MQEVGKLLLFFGLILAGVGILLWLLGDKLSWLGHLPGDIRYERDHVKIYFPITTMLLISILLYSLFVN